MPDVSIIFDKSKLQTPCPTNTKLTYKEWLQQRQPLNAPSVSYQYNTTGLNSIPSPMLNKKNVQFADASMGISTPVRTEPASPKMHNISVFDEHFRRSNSSPKINKIEDVPLTDQLNVEMTRPNCIPLNMAAKRTEQKDVTMADLYELTKMLMHQVQNQGENGSNSQNDAQRRPNEPTVNNAYTVMMNREEQRQRQKHSPLLNEQMTETPMNSQQSNNNNYYEYKSTSSNTINSNPNCCARNDLKRYEPQQQIKSVYRKHNDDEPTVKDLFQIIIKQQEQLIHLQEQVKSILLHSNSRAITETPIVRQSSSPTTAAVLHKPIDITMQPNSNEIDNTPKTIGVMTSFEINIQQSFASATNQNPSNDKPTSECECRCKYTKPNNERQLDVTPSRNGIPCNQNQQHDGNENALNENAGWAFYGNILDQVNDVLQNSPPVNNVEQSRPIGRPYDTPINDSRPSNFRTTTQFKKIGFQCDDVNISATAKR